MAEPRRNSALPEPHKGPFRFGLDRRTPTSGPPLADGRRPWRPILASQGALEPVYLRSVETAAASGTARPRPHSPGLDLWSRAETGERPIRNGFSHRVEKIKMSDHQIELVYFDGCPNADKTRKNLRKALGEGWWREWNLSSADTPERYRRYGSPTVLVDGRDVTGMTETSNAMACRTDGAPSTALIRRSLGRRG